MKDVLQVCEELTGHPLEKVSVREWAGPCPACGGKDRLRVWPQETRKDGQYSGGLCWCRQCEKTFDVVALLTKFCGWTMADALREQGKSNGLDLSRLHSSRQYRQTTDKPSLYEFPSSAWSMAAARLIQHAGENRHHSRFVSFLEERGLTMATAEALGIGYIPREYWREGQEWGLETGGKKIRIPRGYLLPCYVDGRPVSLLIKLLPEDIKADLQRQRANMARQDSQKKEVKLRERRFWEVNEGYRGPWTAGQIGLPMVVVESVLDGALILQEAGDLVAVIALRGGGKMPDLRTDQILRKAPLILAAMDADKAGDDYTRRLAARYPVRDIRLGKLRDKGIKDPGEYSRAQVDIRLWIQAALLKPSRKQQARTLSPAELVQAQTPKRCPEQPIAMLSPTAVETLPQARPIPLLCQGAALDTPKLVTHQNAVQPQPPRQAPPPLSVVAPELAQALPRQLVEATTLEDFLIPYTLVPISIRLDASGKVVAESSARILQGAPLAALEADPRVAAFMATLPAGYVWKGHKADMDKVRDFDRAQTYTPTDGHKGP